MERCFFSPCVTFRLVIVKCLDHEGLNVRGCEQLFVAAFQMVQETVFECPLLAECGVARLC